MNLQNKFKVRCSGIGQIMTEPQGKSPMDKYLAKKVQISEGREKYQAMNQATKTAIKLSDNIEKWSLELKELEANKDKINLSQTCITHVHEWLKSQPEFYDRRVNFKSKYCTKGNYCEPGSIEFASDFYGWGFVTKNEEYKETEFLTGTADIILFKTVEDIKNSWSQKTFPLFETEIPTEGYEWQLQGYMEMYVKKEAGLIYTLMDAPEHMIEREARSRMFELGLDDLEIELYEEVKAEMTYSNLRPDIRIKRFHLGKDASAIDAVHERVVQCRNYISELLETKSELAKVA